MDELRLRDGFPGQIMHVVPRPILGSVTKHPLINSLTPTDIGWFPHAHHHYRERAEGAPEHILIFCVEGEGWFERNGQRCPIKPSEALIIPKGTPHNYGASSHRPWSIHWVHFVGFIGDYFVDQIQNEGYVVAVDAETSRMLETLFCECRDTFVANFVLKRMIYASQTLHHLLGCLFFNNRAFSPLLQSSRFHSIEDSLTYLHNNLHKRLTLDMMAEHARLSKSHFVRLFKEQTSFAPVEYFIQLRMQHACMLLTSTHASIGEIALELGYSDPYYFSRSFKKTLGISPTQYRANPYHLTQDVSLSEKPTRL